MHAAIERWGLGAKLAATGLPFLLLGFLATTLTLWVSWQLDGGAAAVNEAGRLRMQAYRLAWTTALDQPAQERARQVARMDDSLALLARGDAVRPLQMPWDDAVRARFAQVQASWSTLRERHTGGAAGTPAALDADTAALVAHIDALVGEVERRLAWYTTVLHLLQMGLLVVGTVGAAVLVVLGHHFVLEPVTQLRRAVAQLQAGDLGMRVQPTARDELGELAGGFNDMADRLQASHVELEARVHLKTAELQEKRERLEILYDVSLLVARSGSLAELAQGFTQQVRRGLRADAAALRWTSPGSDQFVMLAADGLSDEIVQREHCIRAGDCLCGASQAGDAARVIVIAQLPADDQPPCGSSAWATVTAVPVHAQGRLIGEFDLFYHAEAALSATDRALLETLVAHLASGMENLRLGALEREAAVAEERAFLARELHDSIAQSLAFLKIQAQLMRKALGSGDTARIAATLAEIELGLKESHGDVRELLLHFRTRTNDEDIAHALRTTLSKFEHQSGVPGTLTVHDHGLPLDADRQVQALHIVQEALSNVRKHARATQVWVDVWKQPAWRIRVRDDGTGFDPAGAPGQGHVGLRIMHERAARLGADLQIASVPQAGTTVTLTLPSAAAAP